MADKEKSSGKVGRANGYEVGIGKSGRKESAGPVRDGDRSEGGRIKLFPFGWLLRRKKGD